jgi:hypothetical protein
LRPLRLAHHPTTCHNHHHGAATLHHCILSTPRPKLRLSTMGTPAPPAYVGGCMAPLVCNHSSTSSPSCTVPYKHAWGRTKCRSWCNSRQMTTPTLQQPRMHTRAPRTVDYVLRTNGAICWASRHSDRNRRSLSLQQLQCVPSVVPHPAVAKHLRCTKRSSGCDPFPEYSSHTAVRKWCFPTFGQTRTMQLTRLCHPLLLTNQHATAALRQAPQRSYPYTHPA